MDIFFARVSGDTPVTGCCRKTQCLQADSGVVSAEYTSLQTFERPVLLNLHPDHTDRIKEQTAPGKPRTQTVTTGLL